MNNVNVPTASSESDIQLFLKKYPEWSVQQSSRLERLFTLKSYFKGLNFLQTIGWLAQKKNHHPDMELKFSSLKISLTTHDINNKISNLDLEFAELIEQNWF